MAEDALDAIALPIEALVVTDCDLPVRFGRDHGRDAAPLQIGSDGVGVVGFVGKKSPRFLFRQIDQRLIGVAVRRLARREVEGDGLPLASLRQ